MEPGVVGTCSRLMGMQNITATPLVNRKDSLKKIEPPFL